MMFKRTRWWLLCCTFSMIAACSSDDGPGDDTGPDTGDTGDAGDTPPPPPPPGSLEKGDLCDQDAWCASGFCVKVGNGYKEGVCSQRCEEADDCDDDSWECIAIAGQSSDAIKGCIPEGLCIDKDGDGYGVGAGCKGPDCNDDDPLVYPGADEICDGKDNDCDDIVDNNLVDEGRDCDTGLLGVCTDGITECNDGVRNCKQLQFPSQEICDELDNDCDGLVDETREEDENGNSLKLAGTACTPSGADCANGIYVCDPSRGGDFCDGLGAAAEEICDGIDNNCDGRIDEGILGLGEICTVGSGRCINSAAKSCDPNDPNAPPICDIKPRMENATEEICDYDDNTCDGTIDGPFVNEAGIYHLVETCGGCETDCRAFWGDSTAAAVHAVPLCNITGVTAACGFSCESNFVDVDGDPENGCELLPDTTAIYVTTSAKGGADTSTCGNYDFPCATITHAIARAKFASKKNVRVSEGVFREGVVLENGISVLGGHSSINWLRDLNVNTTTVFGSASSFPNDAVAMSAKNITSSTEVSGLSLVAPDAPVGGNSIGLYIEGSSSSLKIRDNSIQAGVGGPGVVGTAGSAGTAGVAGGDGAGGDRYNTCSGNTIAGGTGGTHTCASTNVSGGAGAGSSCPTFGAANPTGAAANGLGNATGTFGEGGFTAFGRRRDGDGCLPKSDKINESFSSDGLAGRVGADGAGGTGAQSTAGQVISSMWRTASGGSAAVGAPGGGGGGGGASHGVVVINNNSYPNLKLLGPTGGGGGSGGCAGAGASGGGGGGASFALYILATSDAPVIEDNTLIRGIGGAGGIGGIGGPGAFGGAGGVGRDATYNYENTDYCADLGRKGGDGGRGGHGGGGGGGAGGHAHDIAHKGLAAGAVTALSTKNTFVVDSGANTAGQGGDGGPSMGTVGQPGGSGLFGQAFQLP